jgi:hypothetical protein
MMGLCLAGYFVMADQPPAADSQQTNVTVAVTPQPAPNNVCPNGTCPNGCCPNGYCRQIRVDVCKTTPRKVVEVQKQISIHDDRGCPPHREPIERYERRGRECDYRVVVYRQRRC